MDYATEATLESVSSFEAYETGGNVSADDWFKGIALSLLASVIGGASKLAIRKSWLIQSEEDNSVNENENDDDDDDDDDPSESSDRPLTLNNGGAENPYTLRSTTTTTATRWWIPYFLRYSGMFGMSVLNPICCVLAMNYASPSILAPFSGLTLVWVILFSHPVVGEKPTNLQVIAAMLIIAGEVIVAVFGDHTNDDSVSVEDVRKSYQDPAFITYLVALALYMSLLYYWIKFSKNPVLKRFAWGSCGGALTGLQNFLKDSLTIIKATEDGHYPWFFLVFVLCACISAFGGLLVLTACMKRYDTTYSAASFVGSFVVSASIMSAAHYQTFEYLKSTLNYVLYPSGLVVLMIGVFVLVRESKESGEESSEYLTTPLRKNSEDSQTHFMYIQVEESTAASNQPVV